jgi:glycosyltransferase involved in cell wall biosynthesis
MLRPKLAGAFLITQGDIEDDEAASALASLASRHLHRGWQDDVFGALAVCDALVLPTHREGFPNVVLEASAAGIPVVTTTATGAIDSVVDGVTGFLVPPSDATALAAALARLADDPDLRRRLGANAAERARREFNSEVIWEAMADLYKDTSSSMTHQSVTAHGVTGEDQVGELARRRYP